MVLIRFRCPLSVQPLSRAVENCVLQGQSFSFWRIQIARVLGPPEIHLLLRIPAAYFVSAQRPSLLVSVYSSSHAPARVAMIISRTLCFPPVPSRPLASRPPTRLACSSAHLFPTRRMTQSRFLSVPCAILSPANLASIANSNSAPTISIPVPTVAISIVATALTLTTPMVTGLILTLHTSSPPHKVQFARRLLIGPILTLPPNPPRRIAQIVHHRSSNPPPLSV